MMQIAILHEGNQKDTEDKGLLKLLLDNLKLDTTRIKFFAMRSKSNFFDADNSNYAALKEDIKSERIEKVLFVVDADNNRNDKVYGGSENTQKELEKTIKGLKLNNASIYITCDPDTQEGYLESLILSSIPDKHKKCIEDFLTCSDFKDKQNHKAILHQVYKIAYPKKPYDFSHKNFNTLKQKLINLFN